MNCNVIQDLIPLYLDGCCSAESAALVEAHTAQCPACRALIADRPLPVITETGASLPRLHRVSLWKASILQTGLFLLYFGLLTVGVALEARTPAGDSNGVWFFSLVVPAAGFLVSMVHWHFIRLHRSRRSFLAGCLADTAGITLLFFLLGIFHYSVHLGSVWARCRIGLALLVANLAICLVCSSVYARMVGKE